MRVTHPAVSAAAALAALLPASPVHASGIMYGLYTRIVEAEVSISPVPGSEDYIFALGTSLAPPAAFDTGLQTVSRSYTDDEITATATTSVRQVVVPGVGPSISAWSTGETSQTTGGSCDEWGCSGAGAFNRVGSSWYLSIFMLQDFDYELTGSAEHARVELSGDVPIFSLLDSSGSTSGRLFAGRSYTLEAAALFSTFTGGEDPYICCTTVGDRFAWSFDLKLTPVPLPLPGALFVGALVVLGELRARPVRPG